MAVRTWTEIDAELASLLEIDETPAGDDRLAEIFAEVGSLPIDDRVQLFWRCRERADTMLNKLFPEPWVRQRVREVVARELYGAKVG